MRRQMGQHSQIVSVDIDGAEVLVECIYDYTPGYPATGPSYASGGEPGAGPEIEITEMKVDGNVVPGWFYHAVIAGEKAIDFISEHHEVDEGPDPDDARDRERDERLERT